MDRVEAHSISIITHQESKVMHRMIIRMIDISTDKKSQRDLEEGSLTTTLTLKAIKRRILTFSTILNSTVSFSNNLQTADTLINSHSTPQMIRDNCRDKTQTFHRWQFTAMRIKVPGAPITPQLAVSKSKIKTKASRMHHFTLSQVLLKIAAKSKVQGEISLLKAVQVVWDNRSKRTIKSISTQGKTQRGYRTIMQLQEATLPSCKVPKAKILKSRRSLKRNYIKASSTYPPSSYLRVNLRRK